MPLLLKTSTGTGNEKKYARKNGTKRMGSGAERHVAHEERRAEERHVAHEEHVVHEERRAELRHISDEHFHAHFGREHYFAVGHVTMVAGHPHFAYGGYRFEIGQPWPARWAYTDHCYIDFVEGRYFLFNPRYPGVRVAVAVVP